MSVRQDRRDKRGMSYYYADRERLKGSIPNVVSVVDLAYE